jgi:hypothetical protein
MGITFDDIPDSDRRQRSTIGEQNQSSFVMHLSPEKSVKPVSI